MVGERRLRAGKDCPKSALEFREWFATEKQCRDFLFALKYSDGWECSACGADTTRWRNVSPCEFRCTACAKQYSVTAGTIFDRTQTPLVAWFHAAWLIATAKNGVSAMEIQRELGLGSYQTAWTILHRFRRAMVFQNRSQLHGTVEIDETLIGGVAAGKRGRGAKNKIVVLIMVEDNIGQVVWQITSSSDPERHASDDQRDDPAVRVEALAI